MHTTILKNTASVEIAFTTYLAQYQALIWKVAGMYISDYEERKDLVQEIIIQLWKAYPKYDSQKANISTWTYRIALNVSISYLRKGATYKKHQEAISNTQQLVQWTAPKADERLEYLYKLIEQLKPLEKAVLTLHLDACKNKEIAEILGMTASNVSTRLLRVKEKLKNLITQ